MFRTLTEALRARIGPSNEYRALREACPVPSGRMLWAEGVNVMPDHCRPLDEPTWVAGDAAEHMRGDDPVLGLVEGAQAWALPWWVMKNHHVANLELAGRPLAVIFCEACSTGGLYDPVLDGTRYTWSVTGVAQGVTFMRDHQTGSLWNALTMLPIHGEAEDLPRLERLPLVQCRWENWVEEHPDTMVAFEPPEARSGHGSEFGDPWHRKRPRFNKTRTVPDDDRLDQLALVLGVDLGEHQTAYPLEAITQAGGVINDRVGGTDVVVVNRPDTWIASAFHRAYQGALLDLIWDGPHLVDTQGRGRWSELGVPTDTVSPLRFLRSGIEKWFAWSSTFPGARLYGHE